MSGFDASECKVGNVVASSQRPKRTASERVMEDEMQAAMSGLRKRLDQIDSEKENRLHAAKRRRSSSMAELVAMAQGLVG